MGQVVRQAGVSNGHGRARYNELKGILEDRRQTLQGEVRDGRALFDDVAPSASPIALSAGANMQDETQAALLGMKAETLRKTEDAIAELDRDTYGYCQACGSEIAVGRLRALPFAAHCAPCEAARGSEFVDAQGQTRRLAPLLEVLG